MSKETSTSDEEATVEYLSECLTPGCLVEGVVFQFFLAANPVSYIPVVCIQCMERTEVTELGTKPLYPGEWIAADAREARERGKLQAYNAGEIKVVRKP